ncbi:MobF family relaxase [Microbacterium aurugineum]|uniref:MobF family relaxase n=1 Tax=Microbacterium aurugineum TaxID=2851642 RepID=UPI0020BD746B|nr:MobF family relaxase [Microbacterium aurugineum]MCK8475841.1 AAA family ATPase [Microbacterium aurugineum]
MVSLMHGGVILFRGTGADARRYVEADRSRADDYYLGADTSVAEFTALDDNGNVTASLGLEPEAYAGWVDWINPLTEESMGKPRLPGEGRQGSPRFAEMVVNAPKSLSIAAALHPEVSDALDRAQQDAVGEIQRWLAQHSVTRVGPRGKQEVVPVEQLQTVAVSHRTSRAGDPHRHIHFQIGTRIWAAGKWRALDTAALFRQQGAIRALGTAVIAAHPELAEVLDRHGLTLDPVSGEVVELERFNGVMSKRGEQVRKHLERLEAEWEATHPGETVGPVVSARLAAKAWAHERPAKKPTTLSEEQAWVTELQEAGYDPSTVRRPAHRAPASLDDLSVQTVANRALDRCAAGGSAWTRHTVQEHVTQIMTEYGVQAAPVEIREFVQVATSLAMEDCFSILPPGAPTPEHVAHLTSLRVVQAETELRELIAARIPQQDPEHPDVRRAARRRGLDAGQERAAAAVASTDPLVVVEGAAGSGKTTMLDAAIEVAARQGRVSRVVAPTLRAAQVAHDELGVPATSVAALVHAHGWRRNSDGVWTRLAPGDTDPETGRIYRGPAEGARLGRGERVIVDEAGMLDQDTAIALLTVTAEAGATVTLVGDGAQLAAVGRGGVLDMAAQLRGRTFDMAEVHRFTDPDYAEVTVRMRDGRDPGAVFDRLTTLGLVRLHASDEEVREHIAAQRREEEAVTVTSNDEARTVNARIREERVARGEVDDRRTTTGRDSLPVGVGDVIQTRKNNTGIGVANRQNWIVQHIEENGTLRVREAGNGRKRQRQRQRQRTVRLPAEYVAAHAHLSYAATAYGVQGATVTGSHTILTDATSAASVYVGMTRGREQNLLYVVAESQEQAREQFIAAMERDRADRGLTDATERAAEAVHGLVEDGPVRLVQTERARLTQIIERAEQHAAVFEEAAARFAAQKHAHQVEAEEHSELVAHAKELAEHTRHTVTAEVETRARGDGQELVKARTHLYATRDEARAARFGRRRTAARSVDAAEESVVKIEQQVTQTWGTAPSLLRPVTEWAQTIAAGQADAHPEVRTADQALSEAETAKQQMARRQAVEQDRLTIQVYGADQTRRMRGTFRIPNPRTDAEHARKRAAEARDIIAELDARPVAEAAEWLTQRREQQRAEREALQARQEALAHRNVGLTRTGPDQRREGPGRSL